MTDERFLKRIEGIARKARAIGTVTRQINNKSVEKVIEETHIHKMEDDRIKKTIFEARIEGKNKIGRLQKNLRGTDKTVEQRNKYEEIQEIKEI